MEELVYLYGIIPHTEKPLPHFKGIDDEHDIYTISFDEIEAVVCKLNETEYGEKALEEKMNQVDWLHQKAFHHHEALMKLYENCPIIPMKFCTIYSGVSSLEDTISGHHQNMSGLLDLLADKEEWNLKIYCDQDKLWDSIIGHNSIIEDEQKAISELSPGRQYLAKRKLSQLIEIEADNEKESFSKLVHAELDAFSMESEVKKNWNKDVTGRMEEMCWNSVYLIDRKNVESFLSQVKGIQEKWAETGWLLELTGPWPAYHFANISEG